MNGVGLNSGSHTPLETVLREVSSHAFWKKKEEKHYQFVVC